MKLSDSKVRNLKPRTSQYEVYDAHGLFLIVSPRGGKWWRYRFKQGGKEKTLSLGIYDPGNVFSMSVSLMREQQEMKWLNG